VGLGVKVGTGVEPDGILVEEDAGPVAAGVMCKSVVGEAIAGKGDAWGTGNGSGVLAGRGRVTINAISPLQSSIAPT
jgi:hypothetical protein